MTREFWDTVTPEDVPGLVRPELDTGKPMVVSAPASPTQKAFIRGLVERADDVRKRRVSPKDDNMLAIVCDGAKAALDMRILDSSEDDPIESKVNACVRNVFEIWAKHSDVRATQIIFCDLSVGSNPGFSVYGDIRRKLIDRGIPDAQVAVAQDASTHAELTRLDRNMNAGKVRVLLGSSAVLGIGRNVQKRLFAWHHLDVPYRADEVEQRDGRGLRQGNSHRVVQCFRYVTEGSFDAYKWQTVERKARFTAQFRKGTSSERTVEDLDSGVMSYAEIKAVASGDARVRGLIMAQMRLKILEAQVLDRNRMLDTIEREVNGLPTMIETAQRRVKALAQAASLAADLSGDRFVITIRDEVYRERSKAGTRLLSELAQFQLQRKLDAECIGQIAGYQVGLSRFGGDVQISAQAERVSVHAHGGSDPVGLMTRMVNACNGFAENASAYEARVRHLSQRLPEARAAFRAMADDHTLAEQYDRELCLVKQLETAVEGLVVPA